MTYSRGWFAEVDEGQTGDYCWRASLQLDGFIVTTDGPWFRSEADCLDFIGKDIIGQGMWEGP